MKKYIKGFLFEHMHTVFLFTIAVKVEISAIFGIVSGSMFIFGRFRIFDEADRGKHSFPWTTLTRSSILVGF